MDARTDFSIDSPWRGPAVALDRLACAIEASWAPDTAYLGVAEPGNPALGQCYPTSRVVQWFHPEFEIARGAVWTGVRAECHFWNVHGADDQAEWIDLSWKQFPPGSVVEACELLDRKALGDSPAAIARCERLLRRVLDQLAAASTLDR
jgi:hypothetical protein